MKTLAISQCSDSRCLLMKRVGGKRCLTPGFWVQGPELGTGHSRHPRDCVTANRNIFMHSFQSHQIYTGLHAHFSTCNSPPSHLQTTGQVSGPSLLLTIHNGNVGTLQSLKFILYRMPHISKGKTDSAPQQHHVLRIPLAHRPLNPFKQPPGLHSLAHRSLCVGQIHYCLRPRTHPPATPLLPPRLPSRWRQHPLWPKPGPRFLAHRPRRKHSSYSRGIADLR
jgi:hypothetical protein